MLVAQLLVEDTKPVTRLRVSGLSLVCMHVLCFGWDSDIGPSESLVAFGEIRRIQNWRELSLEEQVWLEISLEKLVIKSNKIWRKDQTNQLKSRESSKIFRTNMFKSVNMVIIDIQ